MGMHRNWKIRFIPEVNMKCLPYFTFDDRTNKALRTWFRSRRRVSVIDIALIDVLTELATNPVRAIGQSSLYVSEF